MADTAAVARKIADIKSRMALPAIAAPMFLVSGPDLVIAACKAGVIGSFPTLNARPLEVLEQWFQRIVRELDEFKAMGGKPAPWAANLIVHRSNPRAADDLAMTLKYKPEIVITALGTPADVIAGVHAYGGLVFADVNSVKYAQKAAAAGADGLVLVAAGAGGHTGPVPAFSFVPAVREFFSGPIVLGGGIVDGAGVRAAEVLGATFAYVGTRFIATKESIAAEGHKQMLVDCTEDDIICTAHFTGVPANYLKPSIVKAGLDPAQLGVRPEKKFDSRGAADGEAKAWRDIWSAGQGVRSIKSVLTAAELVAELKRGYDAARAIP
ncbi:MAG: nitronate monooxygenase [Rhodospirillaceae bacterium]|nr:nitronate monooxygenase [Rhodospirillaceae bacterium]